jgi:4-nitrophenyl phosphatase
VKNLIVLSLFFTNNAVLRREQYAEKLRELGINATEDDVLSASYIAAQALDAEGVRDVFVVGEEGLRDELRAMNISHTEEADDVLVAVDRNFSYWKAARAAEILRDGGTLWTTSVDSYWWAGDRQLPGTDALATTIQLAADHDEATLVGKPSEYAMDVLRDEWSLMPDNTVMIGDNIDSDIVFGNRLGYMTGLVLGGTSAPADLDAVDGFRKPNVVFREFKRIIMKL